MSVTSRREFLAATAAAVACGRLTANSDEYGSWTIGAQSYCFRAFPLERALAEYQKLGLKHAELFRDHLPVTAIPEQIDAALKLCAEYGVKPVAFGVEGFSKDHDKNRQTFDFAKALRIKFLSADPTPDSFDSLDKLCEEYKIGIAIHPHGPSGRGLHRWYSAEVIMAAVKDRHPLIGSCLDTGHLIRCAQLGKKLDPAEQIRTMGQRNFGLHLKDHDNEKKIDVVFGKGALDVSAVLKALKVVQFQGWISIEYEENKHNPTPDLAQCLAVLKAAIQQIG
jgi:sugar phosphate isomerase/epimerase